MAETKDIKAGAMSYDYLVSVLNALPAYAEVTLHCNSLDQRLMARDRPGMGDGQGRRFTNLGPGTEWMGITAESLANVGVTSATFHAFTSEVCP